MNFFLGITSQKGIELYRVFTEGYWIIIPLELGVLTIKMNPRRAFRLFSALKRNGSRFTWLPRDFFNGFGLLCPWLQRIHQVWNTLSSYTLIHLSHIYWYTLSSYVHSQLRPTSINTWKVGFFAWVNFFPSSRGSDHNLCPTVNRARQPLPVHCVNVDWKHVRGHPSPWKILVEGFILV